MIGEGKTLGQAAILGIAACNNQNSSAIAVSQTQIPPGYVYQYLTFVYEQTRRVGAENNQQALNKSRVQALSIPVAPIDEQVELVKRLALLLDRVQAAEGSVMENLERAAMLDRAVLAEAFRGELVSQDPNDEPALALLERIRAARGSAEPARSRVRRNFHKHQADTEVLDAEYRKTVVSPVHPGRRERPLRT